MYMHAKFEVSSFHCSRDMEESQNFKSRSRDPFTTSFDVILHFFKSAPCTQSVCEIWREYLHWWPIWLFYDFPNLAVKCLFLPILGRFFGSLTP